MCLFVCDFIPLARKRPSKGIFVVALSLVCQPARRLFGKGQMSLSLFRYNTNVAVVLNFCDARLKHLWARDDRDELLHAFGARKLEEQ